MLLNLVLNIPEKLEPILHPSRYKIAHGGRGGAKSWTFADALLLRGLQTKTRILCARELQKSIKDSVHRLLADRIIALGLQSYYTVQQSSIKCINGSNFSFEGLKHNANQIKSYEGVDIVWVEEAVTVSKASWDYLIPTIRKEGSEIWVSFNPELEEDETYQRFVVNPPDNAVIMKVNWADNPYFPEVLRIEMEASKKRDPDSWLNVWEGHCKKILEGAIYAKELRKAQEDGRICKVPYDVSKPVHTFWDLGYSDITSIWFMQKIGFEYRLIDFYQNNLEFLPHYVETMQEKNYVYGTDYLPHDGNSNQLGGTSINKQLRDLGRTVRVVPRPKSLIADIQASRAIFGMCYFDEVKCADGLAALRRYCYDIDEDGRVSRKPRHDENSHASDAFRTFASGFRDKIVPKKASARPATAGGWMN